MIWDFNAAIKCITSVWIADIPIEIAYRTVVEFFKRMLSNSSLNMLNAARNILQSFVRLVNAQIGKALKESDGASLIQVAKGIVDDIVRTMELAT